MKEIPLTKGKVAIVDDIDYDYLIQWKWCVSGRYAARNRSRRLMYGATSRIICMHRVIADHMGHIGQCIDHIDGNSLNNCRANLRIATYSQNQANRGPTCNNKSGYKGVIWDKGRWQAQIRVHSKHIYLGRFTDIVEAAKAYNEAALKYFGEFAYLNPIQ